MIYYVYKITLLKGSLAGAYYIGQHRTKKMNDGYAGSGTILRNYYKVYGEKNGETYTKEIIRYCSELYQPYCRWKGEGLFGGNTQKNFRSK